MCGPYLAAAQFAIGAASAVGKNAAANQDADALQAYQSQDRYNAELDRNQKWNQLGLRQQQEHDAASQALMDNQLRAIKARGTADASAADVGVSGNSVEAMSRDLYMQQGRIDTSTVRNEQMSVQQLQMEKDSAESQYRSRTNYTPIKRPSALGLGLEIAGAGVNAYSTYDAAVNGTGEKGSKR